MGKLSAATLAVAVSGVALSLTAGAVVAFADPVDSVVNTTCNYSQVVAAMNAESPAFAKQFNATPAAQAWVRTFLASPPDQRQQFAQQAQTIPAVQQYVGLFSQIANTCNNY